MKNGRRKEETWHRVQEPRQIAVGKKSGSTIKFDTESNIAAGWKQLSLVGELWEGNTFDRIGQLLGNVVERSIASSETGNLSFEEIGILVKNPLRISTIIDLECKGRNYLVRIEEKSRCWAPSFIKDSRVSDNSSPEMPLGMGGKMLLSATSKLGKIGRRFWIETMKGKKAGESKFVEKGMAAQMLPFH
ncbi:hypothetical protein L1987_09001 [Smallanthus sonchifolius]|uniref:Uncharacterized protein n=1 Tax=Smallanthus sonchifolius TaxID=185202 RepID=A0ACB9JP00_9ASTR|nr:hypothetical protein L1987_09001 [Smallanthus sonchifolius]